MSISYNRVVLVGRLTRDPESKYTTSGSHIVKFSIAVDRIPTATQAEPGADFIPITAFGKTADFAANYLSKGRLILVEGRLNVNKYQAQDGTNRTFTDVIADTLRFMETKGAAQREPYRQPRAEETPEEAFPPNPMNEELSETTLTPSVNEDGPSNDDEIPF